MQHPRKGARRRLFLFLSCLLAYPVHADTACPAGQPDETVRVRYVHDGDTVHLEDGRKVRLIGINTPELARDNQPQQAFAREAREALNTAVTLHHNRVGLIYGEQRLDRYQRTLAHLFTPNGKNLQALLLQQGMAMAIAHPPNTVYAECYASQEKIARCQGKGIWAHPGQRILRASDLENATRGFQLVSGEVEHVSQTDKGIWLFMSELKVAIRRQDLAAFDLTELLALPGSSITVRGWLHPENRNTASSKFRNGSSVKYYLRLRHPSALEINPAASETEC
jgi:endonuclease YncB( thermonuclease family)